LEAQQDFPGADEAGRRLVVSDVWTPGQPVPARARPWKKPWRASPTTPVALARLAAVYEREGAPDKAITTYQTSLTANPSNVNAMLRPGPALFRTQQDLPKALEMAKNARKVTGGSKCSSMSWAASPFSREITRGR